MEILEILEIFTNITIILYMEIYGNIWKSHWTLLEIYME